MHDKPQRIQEVALARTVRTNQQREWLQLNVTRSDATVVSYGNSRDPRGHAFKCICLLESRLQVGLTCSLTLSTCP